MADQSKAKTKGVPVYHAYAVDETDAEGNRREDPFWTKIGAAFSHKDGKGMNLVLQALPTNGRVVLRKPKDDAEA